MSKSTAALVLVFLFVLAGLTSCSRPDSQPEDAVLSAPEPAQPEVEESLPENIPEEEPIAAASPLIPEPTRMMETIDALCAQPRPLGSREESAAARYLKGKLEEYGYRSELESFSYDIGGSTLSQRYRQARELTGEAFLAAAVPEGAADGQSQNVIGRQHGEDDREQILVISAHYDSTPDSIGVVDNAAGVAVVLEAARILSGEDLPFALRIVFFGGEEEILLGSRQHVLGLGPDEVERIIANISVDTLAYTDAEEFAVLTPLVFPVEDAAALAEASPVAAALLADSRVSAEFHSVLVGDHMAFSAVGIDSVNFGQSMDAVNGIINSPADNYDILAPELLPVAVDLLVDCIRQLS